MEQHTLFEPPPGPRAVVVLADARGRHSATNQHISNALQCAGYACVLFDVLAAEQFDDVTEQAKRLDAVLRYIDESATLGGLPVALVASDTWAAAALRAAVHARSVVTVVSLAGDVDLAGPILDRVSTPTLLVAGAHDRVALRVARQAVASFPDARLVVLAGHGPVHDDDERTLGRLARITRAWLERCLDPPPPHAFSRRRHAVA